MNRDDELLASFVAGELNADHPEIRELLSRDPARASQLTDLIALRERLEREGSAERSAIRAAQDETSDLDSARVGAALRNGARRSHGWRRAGVLLAAAVALFAGAKIWIRAGEEQPRRIQTLNSTQSIELRVSSESLAPGVELSWSEAEHTATPSDRWKLGFRELDPKGEPGKLVVDWITCRAPHWTPTASDLAGWPDRVSCSVRRVDASDADNAIAQSGELVLSVSH